MSNGIPGRAVIIRSSHSARRRPAAGLIHDPSTADMRRPGDRPRCASPNTAATLIAEQSLLAVRPRKRCGTALSCPVLTDEAVDALLTAPNTSRSIGRRDRALLLVRIRPDSRSRTNALCCGDVAPAGTAPTCGASARDASSVALRSGSQTVACAAVVDRERRGRPRIRCSTDHAAVGRSPETRSRGCSPNTQPTPSRAPRRCKDVLGSPCARLSRPPARAARRSSVSGSVAAVLMAGVAALIACRIMSRVAKA